MRKDNDPDDPVGKIINSGPVFNKKKLRQAGNDPDNIDQAKAKEPEGQALGQVITFVKK